MFVRVVEGVSATPVVVMCWFPVRDSVWRAAGGRKLPGGRGKWFTWWAGTAHRTGPAGHINTAGD